jgi:hypothetical protein
MLRAWTQEQLESLNPLHKSAVGIRRKGIWQGGFLNTVHSTMSAEEYGVLILIIDGTITGGSPRR